MKSYQRGAAAVIALLTIVAFLVVGVVIGVVSYVSNANYGNRMEVNIRKTWENNQNILGQYTLKIQEMASVPEMYKNDLGEVLKGVMTAKFGANGSKAMMQWFKEANIPFDSSLYTKLQQTIEAGRNDFQNNQTRLVDQKREYETALGNVWGGFWLHLAGYPKINLEDYKPVVAEGTREAFKTGVQKPTFNRKDR